MTYDRNTVLTLYKQLLRLYPRGFRERLGESMQQTFNDLYNERKRQTEGRLFGFVLGMFIETAIGIVQEHILLIKEIKPLKNILTNLRLPAIISFLIILPFMFLEFMFVIVKRLNFDLRDALDSIVTFGFLWLGVAAILLILMPCRSVLLSSRIHPSQNPDLDRRVAASAGMRCWAVPSK